jgi:hypothetical protein
VGVVRKKNGLYKLHIIIDDVECFALEKESESGGLE